MWGDFSNDCKELHRVLLKAVGAMKDEASAEAGRKAAREPKSAELTPVLHEKVKKTGLKYEPFEASLADLAEYDVQIFSDSEILEICALSAAATTDSARRSHL